MADRRREPAAAPVVAPQQGGSTGKSTISRDGRTAMISGASSGQGALGGGAARDGIGAAAAEQEGHRDDRHDEQKGRPSRRKAGWDAKV